MSPLVSLASEIAAATSLLDLTTRAGVVCLSNEALLADLLDVEAFKPFQRRLEHLLVELDPSIWHRPELPGVFADVLVTGELGDLIEKLSAMHPLEHLTMLRGLCRKPLADFYATTETVVELQHGTPMSFVSRPVNELFADTTPHHAASEHPHPWHPLGHTLFEPIPPEHLRVVLDFSQRDRLDAVTWSDSKRLPRVATQHPFLGMSAVTIGEQDGSTFFSVAPLTWEPNAILTALEASADAEIAVLPELCLPAPDALEAALATDPERYPPIVVAGSAHHREPHASGSGEVRCNESRLYLDGRCVLVHRKIHPFLFKVPDGPAAGMELTEGLTRERKTLTVLSGDHTRLAVVICSDLNSRAVQSLLTGAWVNLLLVPARTPGQGAFNGAICALASASQGMSVIVNARVDPPAPHKDDDRFLVMAAVPRKRQQSRTYVGPDTESPRGLVDPNTDLVDAMTWIDSVEGP